VLSNSDAGSIADQVSRWCCDDDSRMIALSLNTNVFAAMEGIKGSAEGAASINLAVLKATMGEGA